MAGTGGKCVEMGLKEENYPKQRETKLGLCCDTSAPKSGAQGCPEAANVPVSCSSSSLEDNGERGMSLSGGEGQMLHPQMAPKGRCRDGEATQLHLSPQGPHEPSQGTFLAREGADGDQEQPGWATGSIPTQQRWLRDKGAQ